MSINKQESPKASLYIYIYLLRLLKKCAIFAIAISQLVDEMCNRGHGNEYVAWRRVQIEES